MNNQQSSSFLPSLKRNFSELPTKPSFLRKSTLQKLRYPPISIPRNKENHQSAMLQSCITNNRYEDIMDAKNQERIARNMEPSEAGSNKVIEPVTNYIGKGAALRYYEKYKSLDRTLQRRDLNNLTVSPELNLENPVVSLLQKTQDLKLLPLCMGLVKAKGDICVLNVSDYNLGDRYMIALAAGLKKSRTLEKMYLGGNRMTDLSLAQIAGSISQEVTVLELSRNKITVLDSKILQMIIEPHYRLECLGLANNLLKVSSADAIFRNARYSKHIRRIDLRHNKLGAACTESLVEMLDKSTTLEELYIGGNYLSGRSGEKIFNKISQNKTLRVFDYSFSQLGDETGLMVAQSISNCLQSNRTLQHLDLSFNNFGKEASDIIASGLEANKTLYGIHFRGNYGFINAKGFLVLEERQGTVLHSVDAFRIDGYQTTSPREQNSFESHLYRDVCWICEGWYEQEFKLSLPKSEEGLFVYIHFDFEKYEPRLISLTENVKYVTMVPPKKYRYFFTVNNQVLHDSNASKEDLGIPQTHTYQMNHQPTTFTVACVNYRKGKAKKIVNEWNEIIIKTIPRHIGLSIKKEKEPWQFDKSVWAKEWKLQNEELLRKCFERDWKCSKLTSLIKAQADQDKVKDILWNAYSGIKNLYKYFSSWNPFGDIWAVSSNPFTQFCQQAKIINKDTPLKITDLTFITTNSMSGANYKGNALVPERGLVRFQFMESLVRLAEQKFKKLGITDNYADATNMILKQHVLPLAESYNLQSWRTDKYFNEFNDALIKKFRLVFSTVYKKNSKLKVRPGQKPFMCLAEFKSIFDRIGLNTTLTERQIFTAFNSGMMTQVDQLQNERFMKMTEIQFIEGMARCAQTLPSNCTIQQSEDTSLHLKLQWIVQQLRGMCPEQIKAQVPEMEQSMFRDQQQ